jgi:Inner membrane protein YgaP-like, transmembrane domain
MSRAEAFNHSGFSQFINSTAGRVFRLVAGIGFLVVGYLFRYHPLGVISMIYSIIPLSAGAFDMCFISAVLGGPLSGAKIREAQGQQPHMAAQNTK